MGCFLGIVNNLFDIARHKTATLFDGKTISAILFNMF